MTILERILATLTVPQVAIIANGGEQRFAAFGRPVLNDGAFMGVGPLAGVLAGFEWAAGIGADVVLTVPGDTPFLPSDLASRLAPAPACAGSRGRSHHLIALWPVAASEPLRAHLSRPGPRDVARFAAAIGMRTVDFPADAWDPFVNINTPEDLVAARQQAAAQAGGAGH